MMDILGRTEGARHVYEEAYKYLKSAELKEERVLLVQSWKANYYCTPKHYIIYLVISQVVVFLAIQAQWPNVCACVGV